MKWIHYLIIFFSFFFSREPSLRVYEILFLVLFGLLSSGSSLGLTRIEFGENLEHKNEHNPFPFFLQHNCWGGHDVPWG